MSALDEGGRVRASRLREKSALGRVVKTALNVHTDGPAGQRSLQSQTHTMYFTRRREAGSFQSYSM
jgi:1,4-dihydroxy-2-naphthoyl-CoA synthase